MIEPMKKITFFVHNREKKKMLFHLQKAGVFHLEVLSEFQGQKYLKFKKLKERYRKAEQQLRILLRKNNRSVEQQPFPPGTNSLVRKLTFVEEKLSLIESYENAIIELNGARKVLEPWGEFSWEAIDSLGAKGVTLRLFTGSQKIFDGFDFAELPVVEVHRAQGQVYFSIVQYGELAASLPFEEITLPPRSLSDVDLEIKTLQERLRVQESSMIALSDAIIGLEREIHLLESRMSFEKAKWSLRYDASRIIFYIQGWYPVKNEAEILSLLDQKSISYSVFEPDETDDVPILLSNRRIPKLFEPITRLFSLPNYQEFDPTPFFAPFFTIFFGFSLGDTGYGSILFAISLFFYLRLSKESGWRVFTALGMLLGFVTIATGVLTDTFFGESILQQQKEGVLAEGRDLALFASYTVDGKTVFPVMQLSLFLGYIQILFAILLRFRSEMVRNGVLASFKSLGDFFIIAGGTILAVHSDFLDLGFNRTFQVGPMRIGEWVSFFPVVVGQGGIALGFFLFFLFNNIGQKIFVRPLFGIWEFYQFATGLLGDLLSYIRLFALGLASGLLGSAFNQIAFMILPRTGDSINYFSPWIVVTALILIAGHGLNLALSLLGSFVHPLRLTFVEFYKNIQFKGGGRPYDPFVISRQEK